MFSFIISGCVRQPPKFVLWGLCPLTVPLSLQGVFANHPITPVRVCRYHPCSLLSQGAPSVHSPIYCQVCLVVICAFVSEFVVNARVEVLF